MVSNGKSLPPYRRMGSQYVRSLVGLIHSNFLYFHEVRFEPQILAKMSLKAPQGIVLIETMSTINDNGQQ